MKAKTFRKTFVKSFIKKKPLGKASAKKHLGKASAKAQSAMEYLMTYGWAILIISVVLAALFQLGVFNPMTFAPKAPPGACQVFRPYGPGTTSFINLEGICSGELPQYVASFKGVPIEGIKIPSFHTTNFTISVWFYDSNPAGTYYGCSPGPCCSTPILDIYNASVNNGVGGGQNFDFAGIGADDGTSVTYGEYWPYTWYNYKTPVGSVSPYTWVNVIVSVYNYDNINVTINGRTYSATFSAPPSNALNNLVTPALSFASNPPGGDEISSNIRIANVQIYNTSLSANEIQALYLEGIGGAPIRLQNLVAWWPLNGDAKDYSGNGNNGQINNVNFVSNWYSGYTPP
ncbi:MAG: hypothetical protein RXO43_02420 [Candidatus Micrarchaeota archaeon]